MHGNETMRQQMNKMEEEIKKLKNGDIVKEMKDLQESHMKKMEQGMEKKLTEAHQKIRSLEKLLTEKEDELTKKANNNDFCPKPINIPIEFCIESG